MAAYTHVSEQDTQNLLASFKLGTLESLQPIEAGVENTNYMVQTDSTKMVLTLFEGRVDIKNLPWYFDLQSHLKNAGLPVAQVLADENDKRLHKVHNIPAALIEFLDGETVTAPTPEQTRNAAASLAKLHLAAQDFTPIPNPCGLKYLRRQQGEMLEKADDLPDPLYSMLEKLMHETVDLSLQETQGQLSPLPRGVIHADLFPDNVLFDGNTPSGLIDFYFAGEDDFLYDLAIFINAWAFDGKGAFHEAHFKAAMAGYTQIRPLEKEEKKRLNRELRRACVRFITSRLYDTLYPKEQHAGKPHNPLPLFRQLMFHQQRSAWEDYPHD